jgi:hypothetical protein
MAVLEEPKHVARQNTVADRLAKAWRCEWGQMGPYSPFDVYLMRDKKIHALVEIRTRRDRTCHAFTTVLIDLDKWFSLMQGEIGLQMPCFYVVAFTDGIWFVRIGTLPVNAYKINYRGRTDRPQAANDLSPVIEVPSDQFQRVCDSDGVFEN